MAAHIPQPIAQTLTKYEPPLWLSHRPIWLLPYEPFDGIYAEETDCKYLRGRNVFPGRGKGKLRILV
jgi:hypothetical protein